MGNLESVNNNLHYQNSRCKSGSFLLRLLTVFRKKFTLTAGNRNLNGGYVFIVSISDCLDDSARARVATRAQALFGPFPVSHIAVQHDITAALRLVEQIDASLGTAGVIMVNIAPRGDGGIKYENGTPFCYFWVGKTLVISTYSGLTLSLVHKLGIKQSVMVMDIPTVLAKAYEHELVEKSEVHRITHTQFRSYEFVPRAAYWIFEGLFSVPAQRRSLRFNKQDLVPRVGDVDNFGNIKTTLLRSDLKPKFSRAVKIGPYTLPFYTWMHCVPAGAEAVVVGSSGIGNQRFLELIIRGGNAGKKFSVFPGQRM